MRMGIFLWLLIALVGTATAQETNFPAGPQYLMTNGSPLFARPIATPTLTLGELAATATGAAVTNSGFQGDASLPVIHYGAPRASVIELSLPDSSVQNVPASITNVGVMEMTDVSSLRQRGFGVTLPEAAAYWKKNKRSASRVYTNRDIERLRNGS
jgi:hypothetical protein